MKAIRAGLPAGTAIEVWWQDEARVGQKNTLPRRWARCGTRPSAPKDQRTAYAYIFGAICPEKGKGAGLVLPRCDSEAMNLHLAEISRSVAPGEGGDQPFEQDAAAEPRAPCGAVDDAVDAHEPPLMRAAHDAHYVGYRATAGGGSHQSGGSAHVATSGERTAE